MIDQTSDRPAVGHICLEYLPRSQTFIYNNLVSFRRTRPVVVSYEPLVNLEYFPFRSDALYAVKGRRFSGRWIGDFVRRRLLHLPMQGIYMERFSQVLRSNGSRLLHAHFGNTGTLIMPLRRYLGLPLVTNFYGADTAPSSTDPTFPELRRRLFVEGDLFLVEGPHMRQRLIDLGCPPEKIRIQRIALRISDLPPAKNYRGQDSPQPRLLFAGRFVEKKGLVYALEACEILARRNLRFELRVIGDGPLNDSVRRFVRDRRLNGFVQFLGFLSYADYLRELREADALVQPSVTAANGDTEGGAPTTILEAQALGVPVVATRHADIPNVVARDGSAFLVPERDSRALAEALERLITAPEVWPRMGEAGRAHVREFHDVSREIDRLEDAYLALM